MSLPRLTAAGLLAGAAGAAAWTALAPDDAAFSLLLVALALLSNRFVPLALVVMAPITINIVLLHAVLAPEGLGVGLALLAMHLALAWSRRENFRGVLAVR